MVEQGDVVSDEEPSREQVLVDLLFSHLRILRSRQSEIVRLSDLMSTQTKIFDDQENRAREHIRGRLDEDIDEAALSNLLEVVRSSMDEGGGTREEADEAFLSRIDSIIEDLPEIHRGAYLGAVSEAVHAPGSGRLLLGSLLVTSVAETEVFLNYVARSCLHLGPDHQINDETSIKWSELRNFESLDQVRFKLVSDLVDSTFRGSMADWIKLFEDRIGVGRIEFADTLELQEVFQRRHCIAHNGGQVSTSYLRKLKGMDHGQKQGDLLLVDTEYLRNATDNLFMLCFSVIWACLNKLTKDSNLRSESFDRMSDQLYELMQEKRYSLVIKLNSKLPSRFLSPVQSNMQRVNVWLSYKELGRIDEVRSEIQDFDAAHLNNKFKLAKLALMGEVDAARELAFVLIEIGELDLHSYVFWPIFKEVRARAREIGVSPPSPRIAATTDPVEGFEEE